MTADTVIPYENETQSWNRFSYVRNNPIIYKDPTEHEDRTALQVIRDPLEKFGNLLQGNGFVTEREHLSSLQKGKDSSSTRLSGRDVKQQMLDNFNPRTNTTLFGDTKVTFTGIADPKKSMEGLSDKVYNVLGDISKKFIISDMTISSLARNPLTNPVEGDPHRYREFNNPGGGRGLDITYMKSKDGREALFQDYNFNSPRSESPLANEVTREMKNHRDVKQVFTPWQMKNSPQSDAVPNQWREKAGQTPKSNDEWHNNHIHIGV